MPLIRAQSAEERFPVCNSSVTDLLELLESRWFGVATPEPIGSVEQEYDPSLRLQPLSASQLSNGKRSGSSERMVIGSGEDSIGGRVGPFPSAGAGTGEVQNTRLPPQPSTGMQQQGQQPPQDRLQDNRPRSEHMPANSGLDAPVTNGGGAKQQQEGDTGGPLGTWANRQRIFLQQQANQAAAETSIAHTPAIHEGEEEVEQQGPSAAHPSDMHAQQEEQQVVLRPPADSWLGQCSDSVDEEDEMNAAWRWRFARKWQTEQAKQFDPEYGKEGGDDEWGDALGYMDALAGGLNLQIGRTMSADQYASLPLLSPTLSQSMLLDASVKESPLTSTIDDSSMNATKHIVAVARRAQQLLQQQQEIERQVEQRWECATAGQPWVGQHLPAVTVDSWGRFPFVLVRLMDLSNRQKLLVRGRNGVEEASLFAQLELEVSRAAVQHRLPGPRLELLGSGVMEWSRDRDRTLNVTAHKLHSLTDARLRSKGDVSKLAGALAQSSLPVTYKILVEGNPPS